MVCNKCRYVNKAGAEVCRHCGAPLMNAPEAEHIKEAGDIEATRVYVIKSAPRTVSATKVSVTGDAPATVKTVSFKHTPAKTAAPREYGMEPAYDDESDVDAQGERRDSVKSIAIISAVVFFVAAAVIVLSILLSQTGKTAPAGATAQPTESLSSALPSDGQTAE
jgi:hypothetical protein